MFRGREQQPNLNGWLAVERIVGIVVQRQAPIGGSQQGLLNHDPILSDFVPAPGALVGEVPVVLLEPQGVIPDANGFVPKALLHQRGALHEQLLGRHGVPNGVSDDHRVVMEGFTSERQRRDNAQQHGDQRPEAKVVTKRLHGFGLQGQNSPSRRVSPFGTGYFSSRNSNWAWKGLGVSPRSDALDRTLQGNPPLGEQSCHPTCHRPRGGRSCG